MSTNPHTTGHENPADASASSSVAATRQSLSLAAIIGIAVVSLPVLGAYLPSLKWLYTVWSTHADYSHGFLVAPFALYLLWLRSGDYLSKPFPTSFITFAVGVLFMFAGAALLSFGVYTRTATVEAASIIPTCVGLSLMLGGINGFRWAWPSILFLGFMVPPPNAVGIQMAAILQQIATATSTFSLQLLGIQAVSEGNLIHLSEQTLGVAEACSGIRMLTTFFALTTAICFVTNRPLIDKIVTFLSSPIIAVLANTLRITVTGIAYEFGDEKIAHLIFHELAGWLMMPIGLGFLWLLLKLVDTLFIPIDKESFTQFVRSRENESSGSVENSKRTVKA